MKLFVTRVTLVFLCVLLIGGAANADVPGRPSRWHGWSRLQSDFGLTDTQVQRLKPICKAYRQQRERWLKTLQAQVLALLTPAQRARFDLMRAACCGHTNAHVPPRGMAGLIAGLGLTQVQIRRVKALIEAGLQEACHDHGMFMERIRPVLTSSQYAKWQALTRRRHPNE